MLTLGIKVFLHTWLIYMLKMKYWCIHYMLGKMKKKVTKKHSYGIIPFPQLL